jgi:AraC-like DNA-binding protein
MNNNQAAFARYLPVAPVQEVWGLHVLDGGYTDVPPKTNYPPGQHPESYSLSWENGRILDEFQLVYITAGAGIFESVSGGTHEIKGGTVFMLFPGEWHHYRPEYNIGWQENWIGFNGAHAKHIMQNLFTSENPVMKIGIDNELIHLMRVIADSMASALPGYEEMICGYTFAALSRLRRYTHGDNSKASAQNKRMNQARIYILEHVEKEVDLQLLARKLGMSYSGFRSGFKSATGISPRQFQLQIRINKAQQMLTQTSLPVSQIAEQLGFCSLFYFSRIFSRKTGVSPSIYRNNGLR